MHEVRKAIRHLDKVHNTPGFIADEEIAFVRGTRPSSSSSA